jgi:hypothetical protein
MSEVHPAVAAVSDGAAQAHGFISDKLDVVMTTLNIPELYTKYAGDTPTSEFWIEWFPLLATAIFPILAVIVSLLLCARKKPSTIGQRAIKRAFLGSQATMRMVRTASGGKYKGVTNLSAMEGGAKGAAKGKAEEDAIKAKAATGGRGGRFY